MGNTIQRDPRKAQSETNPKTAQEKVFEKIRAQREELIRRLTQLHARYQFYSDLENEEGFDQFKKLNEWSRKHRHQAEIEKFDSTISALDELVSNWENNEDSLEIANILIREADLRVTKLEVAQLKKLEKTQNIVNLDNDMFNTQYVQSLQNLMDTIEKKDYSQSLKGKNLPNLDDFFKKQNIKVMKRKLLSFGNDTVADASNVTSGGLTLTSSIVSVAAAVGKAVGRALTAIPIVSAIGSAVPIFINTARTWLENKSDKKKLTATGLAALAVGTIVVTGFATVAAVAVAAALTTVGVIHDVVLPLRTLMNKKAANDQKIQELEDRSKVLDSPSTNDLNHLEKNILLKKLEEKWTQSQNNSTAFQKEVQETKKLILNGKIDQLEKNPLMQNICKESNKPKQPSSVRSFLINQNDLEIKNVTIRNNALNDQIADKKKDSLWGGMAIVGSIMLCIPFPPVQIAGAALICTSAVGGVATKYNLGEKIMNFFTGKSEKDNQEKAANKVEEDLSQKNENKLTNTKGLTSGRDAVYANEKAYSSTRSFNNSTPSNTDTRRSLPSSQPAPNPIPTYGRPNNDPEPTNTKEQEEPRSFRPR